MDRLYSRTLTIRDVMQSDQRRILENVAKATGTTRQDVRKDADGNDMFLYSNGDVVVFLRRKFDEPCTSSGCAWEVDISATNSAREEEAQKKVVDKAFVSLSNDAGLRSRLGT